MQVADIMAQLSPEDWARIEQWAAVEIEKLRSDPLTYGFPPHQGQELLHMSTAKLVLVVAANRVGKTTAGMREVLWRALGNHPYKKVRPHNVIWVGFPSYQFYVRVTERAFHAWLPRGRVIDENKTEKWVKLRRDDGGTCTIYFMSYDAGRDAWQGAAVDCIWLDEECPEEIFNEAIARLIDSSGDMILTYTPVGGMGWSYDRLYVPAIQQKGMPGAPELIQLALAERDPTQPFEVGRILVPHLSRAQVLRFAESIPDEDERAIRVFGEYRARSGAVYKMFRRDCHVVPAFQVPSHWEVWGGVDPGYHGFAVVILALSPENRTFVVGEIFSAEEATYVRGEKVWQLYRKLLVPGLPEEAAKAQLANTPLILYVDTEDPQLVLEMNILAQEYGYPLVFVSLQQGKKARKAGITRIQEMLQPVPGRAKHPMVQRDQLPGEPLLYIHDNLHSEWRLASGAGDEFQVFKGSRLVWEMERYIWKKPPEGAPHPEDADERSAGGAHALAALRYAVMARLGPPAELAPDPLAHLPTHDREVWERMHEAAAATERR